jgi:hypothetical protein
MWIKCLKLIVGGAPLMRDVRRRWSVASGFPGRGHKHHLVNVRCCRVRGWAGCNRSCGWRVHVPCLAAGSRRLLTVGEEPEDHGCRSRRDRRASSAPTESRGEGSHQTVLGYILGIRGVYPNVRILARTMTPRRQSQRRARRLTTACSGRGMDKVPKVKRRQRAADAGRYAPASGKSAH